MFPGRARHLKPEHWVAIAGLTTMLGLCSVARADEVPLTLEYAAPAECPSAATLREAVANLVIRERSRPFSVQVTVGLDGRSYRSTMVTSDGAHRVLSGPTCAEVVEATAVVLALAIGPKRVPVPAGERGAPTQTVSPAAPTSSRRLSAGASSRGDIGTLPHATLGFSGELGIHGARWSGRVAGTYWLGARGMLADAPRAGGEFAWWTGAAEACGVPGHAGLRLELCGGVELGRLGAHGIGVPVKRHPSTPWGALTAEAGLTWPVSGWLRLRASLGVSLSFLGRRRFVLDDLGTVHEPAWVAGRAELGPELVF
jgi:hypothetical protein